MRLILEVLRWYLYRVLQGGCWSLWAGQQVQQQGPLQGQRCPGQLSYDVWPLHPELKAVLTSGIWSRQPNFGELIDTWIKHRHLKSIILKYTFYYWWQIVSQEVLMRFLVRSHWRYISISLCKVLMPSGTRLDDYCFLGVNELSTQSAQLHTSFGQLNVNDVRCIFNQLNGLTDRIAQTGILMWTSGRPYSSLWNDIV